MRSGRLLYGQRQSWICVNLVLAAGSDDGVNVRGQIAREKDNDVALAGSGAAYDPARCTVPPRETGHRDQIDARMVPPAVAARTVPATRVKQMLPALDSTSNGPETYMMRIPPPPVCARTEPRTSPKSMPATGAHGYEAAGLPDGDVLLSVSRSARPRMCSARM